MRESQAVRLHARLPLVRFRDAHQVITFRHRSSRLASSVQPRPAILRVLDLQRQKPVRTLGFSQTELACRQSYRISCNSPSATPTQ